MGIFSKKENNDFFEFLDNDESNEEFKLDDKKIMSGFASHALTPDEVLSNTGNESNSVKSGSNPLDTLKKRMLDSNPLTDSQKSDDKSTVPDDFSNKTVSANNTQIDTEKNKPAQKRNFDINKLKSEIDKSTGFDIEEIKRTADKISSAASTVQNNTSQKFEKSQADKKKDLQKSENPLKKADNETEKTLLERCMPYIVDDNGKNNAGNSEPIYTLQSVADILKSDSQEVLDKLSKKYELNFDDLGKYSAPASKTGKKSIDNTKKAEPVPEIQPEKQIFEEALPPLSTIKSFQTSLPDISDIDNSVVEKKAEIKKESFETGTIKFTPIRDDSSDTGHISISSQTRPIDLTGELTRLTDDEIDIEELETQLEESEFEEYIPQDEYKNISDSKRLLRKFSINNRNSFLGLCFSILLTVGLAVFKLPFFTDMLLNNTKTIMIISSLLMGLIVIINLDMFKSFTKIFSKKSYSDISASLAAIAASAYAAITVYLGENGYDITLLLSVVLVLRSAGKFMKNSYLLGNFKQIASTAPKNAIKLISDEAVTFAMAKNTLEGDVLVAAPQSTTNIDDYMKYSTYGSILGGKLPVITVLSLLLAVITGAASAAYFDGAIFGLYGAAAILCITAMPCIFLIDNLPLYSAHKVLNKHSAMIAGKTGAERIEMANAVVFSSADLFPTGTVTLHNMKILSENNVDETILRAASLTETVGSPLAPIFKTIAGTSNINKLPDSDTVKYEDRLGLSGWVDNKLLFIGNRTLMEAHGISVPGVEVDKKILRQGYFPVYLASDGKATALIIIQYSVNKEIAHELRRLTSLGVTVLISNSDPNLTEEMICDYLGLYEDSIKVMSSAGVHMYNNAVSHTESCSAPAAYKGSPLGLASIINCASKIKKSNAILTVFYLIASILGIILFVYTSFTGSGTLASGSAVLYYSLICTAISFILYLTEKP